MMMSILIVDDDSDLRALYGTILRREGYDVLEAENGEDALTLLEHIGSKPCLLLLDLMMPVMSGAELLAVLGETGRLAEVVVIVLSATGRPSDVPSAQKFVRKPVAADVLLLLVRQFCGSSRSV